MTERLRFIDISRFVGIFLMVLCHAGMHNIVTSVIYSFHMPLFFFLSGYLYKRGEKINMSNYLMRKIRSILVPYLFFSLILCFGTRKMLDWLLLVYASRDSIYAAASFSPLWFLPCFFLSSIIFSMLNNVARRSDIIYGLLVVVIVIIGFFMASFRQKLYYGYPWNVDVALIGTGFMFLGNQIQKTKIDIKLGMLLLVIGIILSLFNLPESLTKGNPHVEMSISQYGNPFLFFLTSFLLCYAITVICQELEKRLNLRISKFLAFYGSNTITILCVHGVILSVFKMVLKFFRLEGTIYAMIITLLCFLILYPIINLINRELPNIVGKKQFVNR